MLLGAAAAFVAFALKLRTHFRELRVADRCRSQRRQPGRRSSQTGAV